IFVKIFTGKRINVPLKEIEIDSSIRYLRQLIQDKVGISIDQQRLVFEGRQLDPAKDLEDYGIRDGSTLQLIILSRG
ncbi:ubiquitin like protein, partial [Hyaloscypha variabilis F]